MADDEGTPSRAEMQRAAYFRAYYQANREKKRAASKASYLRNRERAKAEAREAYWRNRDAVLEYKRQDRLARPDHYLAKSKRIHASLRADPDRWQAQLAYNGARAKERTKTDPWFRARRSLTARLGTVLRRQRAGKASGTMSLVGCSIEELVTHLERQFAEGMGWDNYGRDGWVIDHIRPCASFDLTDPEQQRACFHFTNLRPLWWDKNRAKAARLELLL